MSGCLGCTSNTKKVEREAIVNKIKDAYKDSKDTKTAAIVKRPNGSLTWREIGDESLSRLEVVEYISIMPTNSAE